ncbi:glycosyltransferase family 2 protein [Patescibacteria group bacterium]|nr:glycosyltransferase family 2 protein [Patescibacteria group bacterium]
MKSISVLIPIYNEELLLAKTVGQLVFALKKIKEIENFEILLIENGSKDSSFKIARKISRGYPQVKVFRLKKPCYGLALKIGIKKAKYDNIIQLDVDFIDLNFLKEALSLLDSYDIIIGSKLHRLSKDSRSKLRILVTRLVSVFINIAFGYQGDTHGIKAYKKQKIIRIVKKNLTDHHFFDTELVLRAVKDGLKVIELPVEVKEVRESRFSTKTRLIQSFKEIFLLVKARKELVDE